MVLDKDFCIVNTEYAMKRVLAQGFTLIELLIVIAVLGILAVAVLSAINPIEQINRSRDTGSRSDAEQLLGGIDRFYATSGYYPWRSSSTAGADARTLLRLIAITTWQDDLLVNVLDKLAGTAVGSTAELKSSFTSRITAAGYNFLYVYNKGASGDSTYICFNGKSKAFQSEASKRCAGTVGSLPPDLVGIALTICNVTVDGVAAQYLSCLP